MADFQTSPIGRLPSGDMHGPSPTPTILLFPTRFSPFLFCFQYFFLFFMLLLRRTQRMPKNSLDHKSEVGEGKYVSMEVGGFS